jgi:hypothetical protein
MIARLFLIGIVGALGVSLPDGTEWGGGLARARPQPTACVAPCRALAFEPIAVDESAGNGLADELNRQAEGLDLPAATITRVATIRPPAATQPVEAVDRLFADNQVWAEPVATAMSAPPAPQSRPRFEPIAVAESASSLADELNRASEGIDIQVATAPTPAPRQPSFEPIAVAEDASSLADELNRMAEGLPAVGDPEPSVNTAIRLTRDAALAWMNVLTKTVPAPAAAR